LKVQNSRLSQGQREREVAADSLVRLALGESVPPLYFERLGRHLRALSGV
jgi:hypothetical protein